MPTFPVEQFMDNQYQFFAGKDKPHNAASNNVSAIGHGCTRYLVFKRTIGDQADPLSPEKKALFEEGKLQEDVAMTIIKRSGFRYERGQEPFGIPDLQIRGQMEGVVMRIDEATGKIVGKWAAEIKKVEEFTFEKINQWEQLLDSPWHYKWLVQLQMAIYHVASKEGWDDSGVLFLKHTSKALVKPIAVPYQIEIVDKAMAKAKIVNEHIAAKTVPERCEYTLGLCQFCEFKTVCQPEEAFLTTAGEVITDETFIAKLERRETLHAESKEFDQVDKFIKGIIKGKPYILAGPFRITGKPNKAGSWMTTIERVMDNESAKEIAAIGGI